MSVNGLQKNFNVQNSRIWSELMVISAGRHPILSYATLCYAMLCYACCLGYMVKSMLLVFCFYRMYMCQWIRKKVWMVFLM
jgi:hypothetical protein